MPTKRHSTEQIVSKLRPAEEELSRGLRTPAMCKKRGISEQTYYRWRTKRSIIRFSKRWPRETSEPAETPAGGRPDTQGGGAISEESNLYKRGYSSRRLEQWRRSEKNTDSARMDGACLLAFGASQLARGIA